MSGSLLESSRWLGGEWGVTAKFSKSICFKKFQLIQDYQKEAVLPGVAPREG